MAYEDRGIGGICYVWGAVYCTLLPTVSHILCSSRVCMYVGRGGMVCSSMPFVGRLARLLTCMLGMTRRGVHVQCPLWSTRTLYTILCTSYGGRGSLASLPAYGTKLFTDESRPKQSISIQSALSDTRTGALYSAWKRLRCGSFVW